MEISKEVSIKDLLKNGTTETELYDILKEQISEAKKEIDAEKAKSCNCKNAIRLVDKRAAAIEALAEYYNIIDGNGYMFADDVTDILSFLEKHEVKLKEAINVFLKKPTKLNKTTPPSRDKMEDYVDKILDTYKKLFE